MPPDGGFCTRKTRRESSSGTVSTSAPPVIPVPVTVAVWLIPACGVINVSFVPAGAFPARPALSASTLTFSVPALPVREVVIR
ncbi:Uncharacterised protein [Shigella sonnei]|nr:Uncharacterised protein [Shigella sonnei]